MSLKLKPNPVLPADTARVAHAILKAGNPYLIIGDQLSEIVSDRDFVDLYPLEGRAAISPALLAMVSCLQAIEGVSDRGAAGLVVSRIDWKYALHLPLEYAGFDYSVLSEFRDRLIEHQATLRVFDKLLKKLGELGLMNRRQQRSDSLAVLGAVRQLNRLELVMETLRVTLQAIARTQEKWLSDNVPDRFLEPYVERSESSRLLKEYGEKGKAEAQRLATRTGRDGVWLLARIERNDTPKMVKDVLEVATLRTVWAQQFEVTTPSDPGESGHDEPITVFRETVAAAGKDTVSTPHDPEVRFSQKRDKTWVGYKLHITETVEEDPTAPQAPQLITDVRVTPATMPDYQQTEPIQQALCGRDLLPEIHTVDNGYVIADTLASSAANDVRLIGPIKPDSTPQARSKAGVALDDFEIDYALRQVRCPQGHISNQWFGPASDVKPIIQVRFDPATCAACPLYALCVVQGEGRIHGRTLKITSHHELIKRRRQEQTTDAFKRIYSRRAGIEATLSSMVRTQGLRFARLKGLAKVNLRCVFAAIGTDLKRATRWLAGHRPKLRTRKGRLAAFVPAGT